MSAAPPSPLAVTGIAAVTPLGHAVRASCAAIRARLSALREQPWFAVETRDPEWDAEEPLKAAFLSELSLELAGRQRLLELGLWVLRDLVHSTRMTRGELERSALLLALPPNDDATAAWALEDLGADLAERAGIAACATTRLDRSGHAGVLTLLAEARTLLAAGAVEQCVVLGIDSYADAARLQLLDAARRLRTARSPDGFLPGEAAVALAVRLQHPPRPSLALLSSLGLGTEPQFLGTQRASTGRGLQVAIEATLDDGATSHQPIAWVLCDLNGESYRSFGDVGAASGGLLIACASQAFERGYAPARAALLWTSSDEGRRAAVTVRAPNHEP
jgi:3-oxoacyl-[acyl-carrier-protein] synthase-1